MITCPSCGAQNDDANRFCDQCGTRLEVPANAATATDFASQPTAAAATCPSCGAVVLPGEAFCDSCGASLQNVAAAAPAPADAPTVFAPAEPAAPAAKDASGAATVTCPMCGHQNLPGDRFCDNCGAALPGDASGAAPAPQPDASASANGSATAVTTLDDIATSQPVPPLPDTSAPIPDVTAPPTGSPEPAAQPEPSAPPAAEPATAPGPDAAASAPIPEAPVVAPPADNADKTRLEEAIARQRQVVAQLEQTQAALGSLTPPAIQQALDDARAALAQAESDLAALPPPKPAVDPAEAARLEDQIAKQRQVVAQLEQTQAALGSLTPPAIQQALDDARAGLAGVEGELATLTGGAAAPAPTAAPTPEAPASATGPAAPAAGATSASTAPSAQTVPAIPAVAPAEQTAPTPPPVAATPATPPPAGPRFVVGEGGAELKLPTDRNEIVVGREDPISQIFPEVDLTPYGGESGGVSRQHARLTHNSGQWMIIDLNSTNYTRVNGARLDPNKPTLLADGAQIQFGRVAVTFHA